MRRSLLATPFVALLLCTSALGAEPDFKAAAAQAKTLLGKLVAADMTNPPGNEKRAVDIGIERLREADIPFKVTEFAPGRQNLLVRLRGEGDKKPILMLAHIDVVGTQGQEWSSDPYEMIEKDGYLVGRGVGDDLGMAAVELEVLILLKQQNVKLDRDVILAWTGDEESGGAGIRWQLEHAPGSVQAEVVLNEGGGVQLGEDGKPRLIQLQTAEKTYQDFELVAHGVTGHSSIPMADNAIYRLSRALDKLSQHRFPARLLPVTRANFAARAPLEKGELAAAMKTLAESKGELPADALAVADANPALSASLRTTCVATLISGGSRANALPAEARATINCRLLPDETPQDLQKKLAEIIADPKIDIVPTKEFGFGQPSPLEGPGPDAIRQVTEEMWPGLPIIPFMSRGASDSRFLRARGMAAYGISPIAMTEDDEQRMHGIDERIPAASLEPAVEFLYRLVVKLAATS